jgi:hypothetical protein
MQFGALIALRVFPALGGDKGCRPFPRTPFSTNSILPSLCVGQVSRDEAEHFLYNRDATVATLRRCSGSSRNGVRIHPGFSVRLRRNSHLLNFGVLVSETRWRRHSTGYFYPIGARYVVITFYCFDGKRLLRELRKSPIRVAGRAQHRRRTARSIQSWRRGIHCDAK